MIKFDIPRSRNEIFPHFFTQLRNQRKLISNHVCLLPRISVRRGHTVFIALSVITTQKRIMICLFRLRLTYVGVREWENTSYLQVLSPQRCVRTIPLLIIQHGVVYSKGRAQYGTDALYHVSKARHYFITSLRDSEFISEFIFCPLYGKNGIYCQT